MTPSLPPLDQSPIQEIKLPETDNQMISIENLAFKKYQIKLTNNFDFKDERDRYFQVKMNCERAIEIEGTHFFKTKRSKTHHFDWHSSLENGQRIYLKFEPYSNICEFQVFEPRQKDPFRKFTLRSLPESHSLIQLLKYKIPCPDSTEENSLSELEQLFLKSQIPNLSCAQELTNPIFLRDPVLAFNSRVEALLGKPLSRKQVETKDALGKLDFSLAPDLDVIWVSSLNFTADFYGQILARLLQFHAEKGTQIRILLAKPTFYKKDELLLTKVTQGFPNVRLYPFQFETNSKTKGAWVDKFHRVNHIKILATIGRSHDGSPFSRLVTGGRNIRDSYLYHKKPNHQKFPWLINYAKGEAPFIFYDDFDMATQDENSVRTVLSQVLKLYYHDKNYQFESINSTQKTPLNPNWRSQNLMRHLISIPFQDNNTLENFYLDLIGAAKKEIWFTTPYFRPTPKLSAALDAAASRGVKIHILTRIQLAGDDIPAIAEEINKKGINRHLEKLQIFEWTHPESIMHAKLLTIDGELGAVTSINLNNRSFNHDLESALLILNTSFAEVLTREIQKFFKNAEQIQSQKPVRHLDQWLINFVNSYF
jgi:phosphatidylserine/phosphatidylglycerophosphate/cardiolipin synthase-like enzyme